MCPCTLLGEKRRSNGEKAKSQFWVVVGPFFLREIKKAVLGCETVFTLNKNNPTSTPNSDFAFPLLDRLSKRGLVAEPPSNKILVMEVVAGLSTDLRGTRSNVSADKDSV